MLDRANHKRLKARERQRTYKARLRAGVTVWRVEIDETRYTKLVRLGYLRGDVTDAREGGEAIGRLIDGIDLNARQ
jgi:hypothetical protein